MQGAAAAGRRRRAPGLVASYLLVVFLLVSLNFFVPRALPGKPIAAFGDPRSQTFIGNAPTRSAVERYYGLDRPLLAQYGRYLAGLAHGDLGTSIEFNRPVSAVLAGRLPWSMLLIGTSVALATAAGMLAGIHSGWRRGRRGDRRTVALFLIAGDLPAFFLAFLAAYVFAVRLGWFPLSGARTPFSGFGPLRLAADVAEHLVLPATVLMAQFTAYQYLVMRAGMVGELNSGHLRLGRAKGLPESTLKYRYAARNALLPSVTVATLQIGAAVASAIFVETVFAYPGLGRLMFDAVATRDYPTLQGCFLVLSLLVVTANLAADGLYRRLDPRLAA